MFTEGLKRTKSLKYLSLSNIDLHPFMAIELSNSLTHNQSIECLDLSGCNLSSFSLSYLFKRLQKNERLLRLNLFNNQHMTHENVEDLCSYLQYGTRPVRELNLAHCNLNSAALVQLFESLQRAHTLRVLDVSLMHLDVKALSMLGVALGTFTGQRRLEELDISYNRVKAQGFAALSAALKADHSRL